MPSFKPVIALARGLDVLRVVNAQRHATVGSLHKATGLDKATIVRMLETLEHEGYVMRDPERSAYAPTGRSLLLSQGYDQHQWIGSIADPILQKVRDQVGWPLDIAIFDRDAMILTKAAQERGSVFIVNRHAGFRVPILTTSLGRAYLAYCGEEERKQIIDRLAQSPDRANDLARHPRRLARMLAEIRERGYALSDPAYTEEALEGKVWAIGVPVRNEKQVFATINIILLTSAVSQEEGLRQFLKPLQQAAKQLADAMTERLEHKPVGT